MRSYAAVDIWYFQKEYLFVSPQANGGGFSNTRCIATGSGC